MAERVTSENTKRMFADALKRALKKKSLSQITVKELVLSCGVNHKTFYYHFRDIYDLVHWTLDRETVEILRGADLTGDYEEVIRYLLAYIRENSYMLNCLCNAIGKQQFTTFIRDDLADTVQRLVLEEANAMGVAKTHPYLPFLCDFLTGALTDMLIDYLTGDDDAQSESELVRYVVYTFRVSVQALLAGLDDTVCGKGDVVKAVPPPSGRSQKNRAPRGDGAVK